MVKLYIKKSKVKALIKVFEENGVSEDKNEKVIVSKSTSKEVKNAFDILLDAKGDTPLKTPKGKVKRCGKNEKITLLEKNQKLDKWLKKM